MLPIPFIKLTTPNHQMLWLNPHAIHAIHASKEGGWLSLEWPDQAGCLLELAGDGAQFVQETATQVLDAIQATTAASETAYYQRFFAARQAAAQAGDVDGGYF